MGSLPSNDIDENLLQYPLIELLDEKIIGFKTNSIIIKKTKTALKTLEYINRKNNKMLKSLKCF